MGKTTLLILSRIYLLTYLRIKILYRKLWTCVDVNIDNRMDALCDYYLLWRHNNSVVSLHVYHFSQELIYYYYYIFFMKKIKKRTQKNNNKFHRLSYGRYN